MNFSARQSIPFQIGEEQHEIRACLNEDGYRAVVRVVGSDREQRPVIIVSALSTIVEGLSCVPDYAAMTSEERVRWWREEAHFAFCEGVFNAIAIAWREAQKKFLQSRPTSGDTPAS